MVSVIYLQALIMKTRFVYRTIMATAATLAAAWAVAPANAALITWSPAADVSAPADVSTTGTLVEAYSFSNATGAATSPDVNGVTFTGVAATGKNSVSFGSNGDTLAATNPGTSNVDGYNGFLYPSAITDTGYRSLLTSAAYESTNTTGGVLTLTLNSLTVGSTYQFEMWVNDSRSSSVSSFNNGKNRSVNVYPGTSSSDNVILKYQTPADTSTTNYGGQFATGTFTADATSEAISIVGETSRP
ncbi:MAG: hypothetical protein ACP5O7_13345 [Phycisphaerae bacterium]